jgi:hypothetical protein
MNQPANKQKPSAENLSQPDFHGASIVTDSGAEIPITEQMLQNTFKALIDAWEQSQQS